MHETTFQLPKNPSFYKEAIGDSTWDNETLTRMPEIYHYYIQVGDFIKAGEPICNLESGWSNGPKGPDLISPVDGTLTWKSSDTGVTSLCGKPLFTIATEERKSAQEISAGEIRMVNSIQSKITDTRATQQKNKITFYVMGGALALFAGCMLFSSLNS